MGYTTRFNGELRFTTELTASQLATLGQLFGCDCREHPEWEPPKYATYIDLQFTRDFGGVKFDGSEKSSLSEDMINMLVRLMRQTMPEFGLTGELKAQGEDIGDRYYLRMVNGVCGRIPIAASGQKVTCPECEHVFRINI